MSSMTGYGGVKLQLRSMNYEGLSEDVENASRAGGGYDTLLFLFVMKVVWCFLR